YQRKEIKDVLAYIRLIINPADEEALKRIINYPARGIGETTVSRIGEAATLHGVPFWSVIDNPVEYALRANSGTITKLLSFRDMIAGFRLAVAKMNAVDFTEHIIRQS
ncbi:MAG: 3'-5' exonuclease, partial [Bacteroidales bacterium]